MVPHKCKLIPSRRPRRVMTQLDLNDPYTQGFCPIWLGQIGGTYLGGPSTKADWAEVDEQRQYIHPIGWNALRMTGRYTVWVPSYQPITTEPAIAKFKDVVIGKYPDNTEVKFSDVAAVGWVKDDQMNQLPAVFRLGHLNYYDSGSRKVVVHECFHGLDQIYGLSGSPEWDRLWRMPHPSRDKYRELNKDEDLAETAAEVWSTKGPDGWPSRTAMFGVPQEKWQYFLDLGVLWQWL